MSDLLLRMLLNGGWLWEGRVRVMTKIFSSSGECRDSDIDKKEDRKQYMTSLSKKKKSLLISLKEEEEKERQSILICLICRCRCPG